MENLKRRQKKKMEQTLLFEIKSQQAEAQHLANLAEQNARAERERKARERRKMEVEQAKRDKEMERKRQEEKSKVAPLSTWVATPLAVAAAAALVMGIQYNRGAFEEPVAKASNDHLVDLLVDHHTIPEEPDARDPSAVAHLEPELGFPVRAPDLNRFGARFEGAKLVPMDRSRVAKLQYNISGRRVTLYMYNPEEIPLRANRALHPSVVDNRPVFIGNRRGYSIATCEQKGIGYAVTGDLGDQESAELVAAVYHP